MDIERHVPIVRRQQVQRVAGSVIQARLGQPFFIDLQRSGHKAGAAWLDVFDHSILSCDSSGFAGQYQGDGVLWWQFTPCRSGTTTIDIVDQPNLINPLFVTRVYTVQVS